ncbi:hypothetical protein HYT57_04900 [Candidatus Woesearchaeota archaeon]|nr:hypothetical protein [Candidatus Woesearchaeota archaeon]
MEIGKANILSAKLTKYDRRANTFEYEILFETNGAKQKIVNVGVPGKVEPIVASIIKEIKGMSKVSVDLWDNSSLDTFSKIDDEIIENAERKLGLFFKRVNDKIAAVKTNKSADGYLNTYTSIAGYSMNF